MFVSDEDIEDTREQRSSEGFLSGDRLGTAGTVMTGDSHDSLDGARLEACGLVCWSDRLEPSEVLVAAYIGGYH